MSYFVKITSTRLKSLMTEFLPKEYQIQYKIGEFVYPSNPNSGLFVYKTDEPIFKSENNFRVFSCEVINPRRIHRICDLHYIEEKANLDLFWEKGYNYESCFHYICDAVKLVKEIK